jgi:hypothetical protein
LSFLFHWASCGKALPNQRLTIRALVSAVCLGGVSAILVLLAEGGLGTSWFSLSVESGV